jgi:hypothetical protein
MKAYSKAEAQLYTFLTSATYEREVSASHLNHFNRHETASSAHWTQDCLGSKASLDALEKTKALAPGNNQTSVPQSLDQLSHCGFLPCTKQGS